VETGREYLLRRARQEREAALTSEEHVRRIHARMAELYEEAARKLDGS
jgi:hypothetical protein